jgi:hypothetical protein
MWSVNDSAMYICGGNEKSSLLIHKSLSANVNGEVHSVIEKLLDSAPHNGRGMRKFVVENSVMHKSLSTNASGGMISGMKALNSAMHKSEKNEKLCCLKLCDTQELVDGCERSDD